MTPPVSAPWYREPMVWLVVAVPLTAVVLGAVLLWLAVRSDDGLVVDDYYRRGKEINLVLARDRSAAALELRAALQLDSARGELRLELRSRASRLPTTIELQLLHATRQGNDQRVLLTRGEKGGYRAHLPALAIGRYHVQLAAEDWRLLGSVRVPDEQAIELIATAR